MVALRRLSRSRMDGAGFEPARCYRIAGCAAATGPRPLSHTAGSLPPRADGTRHPAGVLHVGRSESPTLPLSYPSALPPSGRRPYPEQKRPRWRRTRPSHPCRWMVHGAGKQTAVGAVGGSRPVLFGHRYLIVYTVRVHSNRTQIVYPNSFHDLNVQMLYGERFTVEQSESANQRFGLAST